MCCAFPLPAKALRAAWIHKSHILNIYTPEWFSKEALNLRNQKKDCSVRTNTSKVQSSFVGSRWVRKSFFCAINFVKAPSPLLPAFICFCVLGSKNTKVSKGRRAP